MEAKGAKSNHQIINRPLIVFYVEDDDDDRMMFEDLLAEVAPNATLKMFKNGFDMLYAVTNPPPVPAIIFIDVNLPGINGLAVIQHIRLSHALQHLPLVVFSTDSTKRTIEESRLYGASMYIVKPPNVAMFKKALVTALNKNWEDAVTDRDFLFTG